MLSAFAAVKEPEFCFLAEAKGDRRNIARSRGDTRASSKKGYLHGQINRDFILYFKGNLFQPGISLCERAEDSLTTELFGQQNEQPVQLTVSFLKAIDLYFYFTSGVILESF